jgi:hypothetical protein
MATLVTRAGKGSALTHNEVDANFTNLNTDKAELSGAAFTGNVDFAAGVDVTGNITVTGTVDGRDIATDGSKLDGIEASADVTDTANVTSAGALMDSELTALASVKAINQGLATTDSPTFAAATVNGNIVVTGTVDGRDIAANIPSSLGSAGQFLAVNSGASATEWVDAPAAGTHNFTASGALANGDLIAVNSNGTVSTISGGSASESVGTAAVFNSANTSETAVTYDSTNNKVVVAYKDGSPGRSCVGTVSGSTITWDTGNEATFESGATNYIAIAYDANAQRVVIAYSDGGDGDKGKAVVGTVSGTAISFGSAVTFNSAVTESISIAYDANAQKVVIAYADFGNSTYGTAIVGTVSGTSISFGSEAVFESATTSFTSITYDSNAQKVVISYEDVGNSFYGTAIVGTVSGTSISFGTATVYNSARAEKTYITYDSSAQKVVVAYPDNGNSEHGTAKVGTVSGTSISFGSAAVFESASTARISAAYDANAEKVVIAYRDGGNSSHGTVVSGTVSGTSISFDTPIVFESATTNAIRSTYDANAQKVIITYQDDGNSGHGTGVAYQAAFNSTTLTATNYIGISDAAYSDGATATIQIAGSVDDAQSGLTAGQAYYVQTDGTLSTSADSPSVFAGTAISATKIIVKG